MTKPLEMDDIPGLYPEYALGWMGTALAVCALFIPDLVPATWLALVLGAVILGAAAIVLDVIRRLELHRRQPADMPLFYADGRIVGVAGELLRAGDVVVIDAGDGKIRRASQEDMR